MQNKYELAVRDRLLTVIALVAARRSWTNGGFQYRALRAGPATNGRETDVTGSGSYRSFTARAVTIAQPRPFNRRRQTA